MAKLSKRSSPVAPSPVLSGVNEELPKATKQEPVQNGKLAPVQNNLGSLQKDSLNSLPSSGSELGIFSEECNKEDFDEDPINPLTDIGSTKIKVVSFHFIWMLKLRSAGPT